MKKPLFSRVIKLPTNAKVTYSSIPTLRLRIFQFSPHHQYHRTLHPQRPDAGRNSNLNTRDSKTHWPSRLKQARSVSAIHLVIDQRKNSIRGGDLDHPAVVFAVGALEALAKLHGDADINTMPTGTTDQVSSWIRDCASLFLLSHKSTNLCEIFVRHSVASYTYA